MKREITLAIETAVGGGSLALFEDEREIGIWVGERKISKAEDLLIDISDLLKRSGIEKSEVTNIIYSQGPGSRTGIRVGAATAKGLKSAFGGACQGETVLKALVLKTSKEKHFLTSVQISPTDICCQRFERKRADAFQIKSQPQIFSNEVFFCWKLLKLRR